MRYRVTTYLTPSGNKLLVKLPDTSYGEWIIYENEIPLYHVNCFSDFPADKKIMNLLKDEEKTIESILTNINYHNQTQFSLAQSHSLRLQVESELQDLNLPPIPLEYLEKI
ncbi:MAG: hypothetical protein NVV82_01245 [Sporocytophaga sp.]|nr:hypothetical protein [Sporocytophaga sp.]